MKHTIVTMTLLGALAGMTACGGDDDDAAAAGGTGGKGATGGKGGKGGSSGKGGTGVGGSAAGGASGGSAGSGASAGKGGTSGNAGEAGDSGGETGGTGGEHLGGAAGESAHAGASGETSGGSGGSGETSCTGARDTLLGPIDAVSSGAVSVLSDVSGVKALYVDASAGGYTMATTNPWTYVRLSNGSRVDVTDPASDTSNDWDLAFKRDVIRVNGGDGGPGEGGVAVIEDVDFENVDADVAASATLTPDEFLDADCEATVDETGKPVTGFSSWYDYDLDTMVLTPKPVVFLVRSADGSTTYKLALESYYSTPEGGDGATSARYRLHYAEL